MIQQRQQRARSGVHDAVGLTPSHITTNDGTPMTILRSVEPYGTFRVTYTTVTEESAEQGDYAESGWLSWNGCRCDDYAESA